MGLSASGRRYLLLFVTIDGFWLHYIRHFSSSLTSALTSLPASYEECKIEAGGLLRLGLKAHTHSGLYSYESRSVRGLTLPHTSHWQYVNFDWSLYVLFLYEDSCGPHILVPFPRVQTVVPSMTTPMADNVSCQRVSRHFLVLFILRLHSPARLLTTLDS